MIISNQVRLRTAGGQSEESGTQIRQNGVRGINTAGEYYVGTSNKKSEKNQSINNFETKLKNLKKMYNN